MISAKTFAAALLLSFQTLMVQSKSKQGDKAPFTLPDSFSGPEPPPEPTDEHDPDAEVEN